jgi:hypothetical protein
MNDHRRMAFAAHADVEQMKAALKTLTKAATQRIRRVQAAIAHYERTGIFNVPFVSPAVIRLFDRPAQILGRWEADTTLATRHLIATTSASDLRLAREKMVASQADQLAMVDEAIAQAEAEEAPPADALPDEGAASADQLREAS